jgi:hypothetical protein
MLAHCKAAAEMHKLEKELTGAEPLLVVCGCRDIRENGC